MFSELGLCGLHIGCGPNLRSGLWLNTDIKELYGAEGEQTARGRLARIDGEIYYLEHDATTGFDCEAGVFDYIYSEHFIEHISLQDALCWLKECYRLLRPGGLIRLSTPNLETYMKAYMSGGGYFFKEHHKRLMDLLATALFSIDEDEEEEPVWEALGLAEPSITGSHLHRMKQNTAIRDLITLMVKRSSSRPAFMINQIFRLWGHQWIYDYGEIAFIAQKAGFSPDSIARCRFQQGAVEQVFSLDDPMHNDESLYVELYR
jgi:predicted SAM-dependent methyltransferase